MSSERVLLYGGPFDGTYEDVDPCEDRILVIYDEVPSTFLGHPSRRIELAEYRRIGRHTFTHCRVQTKLGDTTEDLAFPDTQSQLPLEDLPDE